MKVPVSVVLLSIPCIALLLTAVTREQSVWVGMAGVLAIGGYSAWRNSRDMGIVGWSVTIPAFYVMYLVGFPVVEQIIGFSDAGARPGFPAALWCTCIGLTVFHMVTRAVALRRPRTEASLLGEGVWALALQPAVIATFVAVGTSGLLYSFFFGYFGLAGALESAGAAAGVMSLLTRVAEAGLVLAWLKYFRSGERRWMWVGAFQLTLFLCAGLFSKSKGALVFPFVLTGLAYWVVRKRVPVAAICTVVIGYTFIAYPFVTAWRMISKMEYGSRVEMVREGLDLLRSGSLREITEAAAATSAEGGVQGSFGRGIPEIYSQIVDRTGTFFPYARGDTYVDALCLVVPRFLWPDKPVNNTGNKIGRFIGFIDDSDDTYNIAPSVMGEMYLNFGLVGVIVGMSLLALLAAFMDHVLAHRMGYWMLAWSFPISLFGEEAAFSQSYAPFLLALVVVDLTARLGGAVHRRWSAAAAPS